MDDPRGQGKRPARSRIRDKVSLVAGLLGLATAIALGGLLYMGRNYTEQTEPSWWWNALIICGLATGVLGLVSIIFNTGGEASPAPKEPRRPSREPAPERWQDEPTRAVPSAAVPSAAAPDPGRRAEFEGPTPTSYTAVYRREERGWFTEVEEVPGCSVYAPTLYSARAGILDALRAWLGRPVEGRQVVDDVELPQAVAQAVNRAASAKGSGDADAELGRAASVLVDQFALDPADAAALLAVSPEEIQSALRERDEPPAARWFAEDDDAFSPWEGSRAP